MLEPYYSSVVMIVSNLLKLVFPMIFLVSNMVYASSLEDAKFKNTLYCTEQDVLQKCLDKAKGGVLTVLPGNHKSYMANIHSNSTVIISKGAVIKLADDALMPHKGGYVIGIRGSEGKYANNVHIILNGIIDGNNEVHPYEKSGNEGISFGWVKNCSITGMGIVRKASGDGIDVDSVEGCYFEGVKVVDNSGTGFHFGSSRPIKSSKNNIVMNVYASGNGFKNKRNGFDLSWPNPNGAIFVNCEAVDNYRNYEIEAEGGIIYNSISISNGKVSKADDFSGAYLAIINGKNVTNKSWISKKHKVLIKRDIKKLLNPFFNFENPKYLKPLTY